eukprot:Gregarina_sp_Pseudo_9__1483@NODE_19_length_5871_cov_29_635631_g17_i0_p8_GENE_NODE_19_length_5871_cov_29_635631_g17_i0NODE_19_length_5871_cov_29_635631_g17_i0_p8_ORF_typecomplete_len108_score11_50LAX/PF15681_5/0_038_NODE_19_length_5871_cov_29_635631_g17_i052315554
MLSHLQLCGSNTTCIKNCKAERAPLKSHRSQRYIPRTTRESHRHQDRSTSMCSCVELLTRNSNNTDDWLKSIPVNSNLHMSSLGFTAVGSGSTPRHSISFMLSEGQP